VHADRKLREKAAHPLSALPVLAKREGAPEEPARLGEEGVDGPLAGQLLAVELRQLRLVVEGINVADAAGTEGLDDALRLRREVRGSRGAGVGLEQPRQRNAAEPGDRVAQEVASRTQRVEAVGHWLTHARTRRTTGNRSRRSAAARGR